MPRRAPKCPDCGSTAPRAIVYGEPGTDLVRQTQRGEVELGGCCVGDDSPPWHCLACGLRYGFWQKPYKLVPARPSEDWLPLLESMLPHPVEARDGGLWGWSSTHGGGPDQRRENPHHAGYDRVERPARPNPKEAGFRATPPENSRRRGCPVDPARAQQALGRLPLVPPVPPNR